MTAYTALDQFGPVEVLPYRPLRRDLVTLGDALRRHRLAKGLSQQAVADAAGISRRTLIELEAGRDGNQQTYARVVNVLRKAAG